MANITPPNLFFHALIKVISISSIVISVNACGGGGGSTPAPTPTPTYTVGGSISGFSGGNLVLQNNLGDDLTISGNGTFSFSTSLLDASNYAVSVLTQPDLPNQNCTVSSGGNGTITGADITDINIVCTGSSAASVFVSPAVIHNAITQTVRIHTQGLTSAASQVRIKTSTGTITSLSFSSHPDSLNIINATVPSGLAAGLVTIYVTDSTGLDSTLADGLLITDDLSINLTSISKSSISNTINNDLDIVATSGLSSGSQVYIQSGSNPAIQINNIYFLNASRIQATIPAATTAGLYNVIVIDSSGSTGLLADSLTVNTSAAAVINNISPKLLINTTNQMIAINGQNFDTVNNPAIEMACLDESGTLATLAGAVTNVTTTSVNVTFDASTLAAPQTCHINLTSNTGVMAQSDTLSVLNSSLNTGTWVDQPGMNMARNALAMTSGVTSSNHRYLYVIGGDDTNKANAMNSVESLALQAFDSPAAWQMQPNTLPAANTYSGAINIGQFVYVVGGYDGSNVVDTVYRAKILSLEEAPDITSSFITLNNANPNGLTAGVYYYRIAATFPPGDASNPSGESATGRGIEVTVPNAAGAELTLDWEAITGADGYRIYRSPTPDLSFSSLELAGTTSGVASTRFTDTGVTTSPSPVYYEGSLGNWHSTSALNVGREAHAVAVSPNPDFANQFFIYALGGRDNNGTYLDSIEYASVTVNVDGSQTVSAWATDTQVLTGARAELKTWLVDGNDSAVAAIGEYWIYAGPGANSVSSVNNNVDAFQISGTGALNPPVAVDPITGGYKGYTTAGGHDLLHIHGVASGAVSTTVKSNSLCTGAGSGGCEGAMPNLENWNINPIAPNTARIYAGSSQTDANVFIAGGTDGTGSATASVVRAIK